MRLWSLHPSLLDTKGLVALWRETLLAKNVLEGNTKGYKNHPQLDRFKKTSDPIKSINYYLETIWLESKKRGYNFNEDKFKKTNYFEIIEVTEGQVAFEKEHLLNKLKVRDIEIFNKIIQLNNIEINPLFKLIEGGIEKWERI